MSYVRVSILGASQGGEVWSINPVFDPSGELGDVVNQSNLDAAAAGIAAIAVPATLLLLMSTSLTVTGARLEVRSDTDDSLIGISIATKTTPVAGTGAPKSGAQNAVVASLRTNTPGGSGRGRLYWPAVGLTPGADLRLTSGDISGIASGMKTYLLAMRDVLALNFVAIGFDVAVRSKTTKTTPHVVRLQVGSVIDTQRRRRDTLPESYATVSIP